MIDTKFQLLFSVDNDHAILVEDLLGMGVILTKNDLERLLGEMTKQSVEEEK